jgi:hypothetical protein
MPFCRPPAPVAALVARSARIARVAQRERESRSIPRKNAISISRENFSVRRVRVACTVGLAPPPPPRRRRAKNISAKWLTSKNHVISFRPADTTAEASHHEPADN